MSIEDDSQEPSFFYAAVAMMGRGECGKRTMKRAKINNGTRFTASAINPQ
jgi:hypothetical protein